MIKSIERLAGWQASYFPIPRMFLVLMVGMLAVLGGCQSGNGQQNLGSIAGLAHLSDPDPGTGHAGILVYLAGTPFQARTDQQGRYRIEGVSPGSYDLIAEKNGYQGQVIEGLKMGVNNGPSHPLQPADVILTQQQTTGTLTTGTLPLGSIIGRVLLEGVPDENGGVRVEVDGTAFVTVSSNDGQFRIMNVEPGEYNLSYYKEGYLAYKEPDVVRVTTASVTTVPEVALRLKHPGDPVSVGSVAEQAAAQAMSPPQPAAPPGPNDLRTIVGVVEVQDPAGRIMSDYSEVTVAINGTDRIATINDQGQFRFDNLSSGTYTLIGTIPEGPVVQIPVDLETQRTASVSVKLLQGAPGNSGGGVVRGTIVLVDLDDNPLPDSSGVRVAVNGTQSMATTAADGSFSLAAIPAGTYSLGAAKEGFKPGSVEGIEVNNAAPVDLGEIRMVLDVERPRVISTNPADNDDAIEIGQNLPIVVKFSEKMDPATLQAAGAVTLSPNTPATISIGKGSAQGADDDTMVITLSNASNQSPIQFGADYTVTIAGTAANNAGVTMGDPYSFTFETAKPGITGTYPEDGAKNVYVDQAQSPVVISFNTRLDPDSINSRNIRVRPDNGKSVSTTFDNNDANGWTTVRVTTQWVPDTNYTITISRRVKAYNGQSLGNTPYTVKFRTQRQEVLSVPIITVR